MNLKRSDKLIAIVGVVILIVAAVGVVIYASDEEEGLKKTDDEDKILVFGVYADSVEDSLTTIHCPLSLRGIFSLLSQGKSYNNEEAFSIPFDNIEEIVIDITYNDKQTSKTILGIILKLLGNPTGVDTLSVSIIDPDGISHTESISNGNATIEIPVNFPIYQKEIEAESLEEARKTLNGWQSDKWNGENFQIEASLTISGKIWLFTRLAERFGSDSFDVDVSFNYYEYDLEEPEEPEDDEDDDNDTTGGTWSTTPYASMSFLGFH